MALTVRLALLVFVAAAAPGAVKAQTADKTRGNSAAAPCGTAVLAIATRASCASVSASIVYL